MGKSNSTLAKEVEKLKKNSKIEKRNQQIEIEALKQKHEKLERKVKRHRRRSKEKEEQRQENDKRVDSLVTVMQVNHRMQNRRFAELVDVMNEMKRSVEIGVGYRTCLDESYQVGEVPGDALIINNMIFHEAESRTGSAHDAKNLRDLFRMLNIRVQVAQDVTVAQIKNKINAFSSRARGDFTILCILSHGSGNGVMGVEGGYLKYEDLWVPFTRTQNLKGKPKVFIIQACGGNRVMDRFADASPHLTFDPPTHSDILFASSSVAGYVSYRRPDGKGSFFIEELVSVIKQRYRKEHLEDMITAAMDNVIESIGPNHYQVPVKTTTLRKKLYLSPPTPAVMAREENSPIPRRQGRVAIGRQLEMR